MKSLNEIVSQDIIETAEQEARENCEVLIVKKSDVEKVRAQIKRDLERADSLIFGIPYIAITTQAAGLNLALEILELGGKPNG